MSVPATVIPFAPAYRRATLHLVHVIERDEPIATGTAGETGLVVQLPTHKNARSTAPVHEFSDDDPTPPGGATMWPLAA
jgi:hypothetical protein